MLIVIEHPNTERRVTDNSVLRDQSVVKLNM